MDDVYWMRRALQLAEYAKNTLDEVPVGAVILDAQGQLVAEGWNCMKTTNDPSAHAEIVAIRRAGLQCGNYRLPGCSLYVTLEPCLMCAMAIIHARIATVVFAAPDPKTGACGSVFHTFSDPRHNHAVHLGACVLQEEAAQQLREFFRQRRKQQSTQPGH